MHQRVKRRSQDTGLCEITAAWPPQHFVRYEKDAKFLLLESENEDGLTWKNLGTKSAAGWAYDYGKGRVCYLAPGHLLTALWNPEYVKLQKNAVRWVMRED